MIPPDKCGNNNNLKKRFRVGLFLYLILAYIAASFLWLRKEVRGYSRDI